MLLVNSEKGYMYFDIINNSECDMVWNGCGDDVLTVMISITWMRYRDCRLLQFLRNE